tara:strand:- start:3129 stop:5084 length:1956 start_codon:yes stop_codon:yes gene_type:complete
MRLIQGLKFGHVFGAPRVTDYGDAIVTEVNPANFRDITLELGEGVQFLEGEEMRLTKISIKNFRSIHSTGEVIISPLQALVGENNSGKSNILRAIGCFLTSGAGGMQQSDFNDQTLPAIIECEFGILSDEERNRLRPYLLGDKIILRKELTSITDYARSRTTIKAEYHGYQASPKAEHLSIEKLEAAAPGRVKWEEVATAAGILEYVRDAKGKVTKSTYKEGIERYIAEHEIEYEEPVLGVTQALGIPQNLLSALPQFYLLPAITDYSDEVDRRSSSTVFRRLMAELSDRIVSADPRYRELESALARVHALLNGIGEEDAPARLETLGTVEESIAGLIKKLMPAVQSISLSVEVEASRDIFSRGVSIKIDDGVLTDVVDKGHGMQRSLVFALLQMLIKAGAAVGGGKPIILAIEEPELYIHPHCQRLIFRVLREFAGLEADDSEAIGSDQVIYTTHSPAFVEVWNYDRIGVVRKPSIGIGTIVHQAPQGVLGSPVEKKTFKMLTSFGLKHNEVFFAKTAVIVEGPEDEIGIIATARKLGRIQDLPDEIGVSIVVTNGKGDIQKFQKILNAFKLEYSVLLEMDGKGENDPHTSPILALLGANRVAKVPRRVEDLLGLGRHFDDQRHAKQFFSDPVNINASMEAVVSQLLPQP